MRLLASAFRVTRKPEYRDAFDRALAMTLAAQYPSGGWPQQYPAPPDGYDAYRPWEARHGGR